MRRWTELRLGFGHPDKPGRTQSFSVYLDKLARTLAGYTTIQTN